MTDLFRWHPAARLFDAAGNSVSPMIPTGGILSDSAQSLAQALGATAFRIGAPDQPGPERDRQPVFETLTSGSMGRPRRIRRTQASWTASFAVNSRFGIGPGATVAVLGRLIHSLSLYGAVEGLHLGARVHLLGELRPDRQGQALRQHGVTHLYATPAQLRLLGACGTFPDLRLILVGGSKVDDGLRTSLAAQAPSAQIREFYGAAETSFITLSDDTTPDKSVGRPYPGVELDLDADGEVWVRSPYLFLGYGADASAHSAPPSTTGWRDGWLSVGEIGRWEDGFLVLRGRAGRMVTVADQNVFPEEIEAFLHSLSGITRAAVLPVRDARRGTVLVALAQGDRGVEGEVLAALRRELGPLKSPKALIWREEWPLLASGKTDLKALEANLTWPG